MRIVRIALVAAVATMIASVATVAAAAGGPTPNAYGQVFAGQDKCLTCHGARTGRWQVGNYRDTAHNQFITNVQTTPSALSPAASMWPSPAFGGGISLASSDIMWILGSSHQDRQYVTRHKNNGPAILGTGQVFNPVASAPADDYLGTSGLKWKTKDATWANTAKPGLRGYFQSCGGCHHVGVTRPTDKTYTMANGAVVGTSTPTSYADFGIKCEVCHGRSSFDPEEEHWGSGVSVNRTKATLRSQTCGQCHVNGTSKEKNFAGATFSGPNGFTPDEKLSDFFNVYGTQFIKTSPSSVPASIPTTDTRFFPNGSTKNMVHSHYNEFMLTPHARSLRWADGSLWSEWANDSCLPCHSGEGFLKSIGYGKDTLNDIVVTDSNLRNDELNIECAVCHQTHGRTGEPLGLRLSEEELCGRCHNGHLPEGKEAAPGTVMHHPQEEMRQGYGLIGVARPASQFMDDTSCVDCHMPRTYLERASHSFKVMMPADAEAWGVQARGDSCTPCHASKSRGSLQARIDSWQSDTKKGISSAKAGVAAAKARAGASTVQGKGLIARAETNIAYVESDGSFGVHNYPYAKAGLDKAAYFARAVGSRFSGFATTRFDARTRTAWVFGTLLYGDGARAGGQRVTIQARPVGAKSWSNVKTLDTQSDGDFSLRVRPTKSTDYRAVWSPASGVTMTSPVRRVAR